MPWARAGVGAIATQACANVTLRAGRVWPRWPAVTMPPTVVRGLTGRRPGARRSASWASSTRAAARRRHTGAGCLTWAGGRTADGVAVQGNILTGPEVVDAILAAFAAATGPLPDRLLAALLAGDRAGGDAAVASRRRCWSSAMPRATAAATTAGSTCASTTTRTRSRSCGALLGVWRLPHGAAGARATWSPSTRRSRRSCGSD